MNSTATDPGTKITGSGCASEIEWKLLLGACAPASRPEHLEGIRALLGERVDWRTLFHLANHHRVLPLLHQALSESKAPVPEQEMQALERQYQINLHKAMFLSRELIRLMDRLSHIGVETLLYKGLALAQIAYADIALRQTGDIDLLIRAGDFPRIRDAVRELGYTPHMPLEEGHAAAYLKSGYECAFDAPSGPNLLEVQWAIQPRFYAVDLDVNGLFERTITVSVAGRSMRTLSAEDSFVVLSLHAAKHVWGRLLWICDLARIMQLPSLQWERIAMQAKELRIVRILRTTMLLANRLLGTSIPAEADTNLPQDADAAGLACEIEGYVASQMLYDVESLAYFRLMLRLRENQADRLRFLSRLVFTPGPGEWNAVHLPRPLFPLYRVVRLARLAARAVRK